MSTEKIKKEYYSDTKITSVYDYNRFVRGGGRYVSNVENQTVEEMILLTKSVKDSVALDCPVGTGRLLPILKRYSSYVIGGDISPAMIEIAEQYNAQKYVKCSADNLPFEDEELSLWVSSRFFFHFDSLDPFFQEAKRTLKSGGHLLFDVFNWSPRSLLPSFLLGGKTFNHKRKVIEEYSNKFGFEIISQKKAFFIPTYISSFLPLWFVIMLENFTNKIIPSAKTKSYYLLQKK